MIQSLQSGQLSKGWKLKPEISLGLAINSALKLTWISYKQDSFHFTNIFGISQLPFICNPLPGFPQEIPTNQNSFSPLLWQVNLLKAVKNKTKTLAVQILTKSEQSWFYAFSQVLPVIKNQKHWKAAWECSGNTTEAWSLVLLELSSRVGLPHS